MVLRRCPFYDAHDMAEALEWVARREDAHLILVDVEPGLVGWNAPTERIVSALTHTQAVIDSMPVQHEVRFISNAHLSPRVTDAPVVLITAARKPFTRGLKNPQELPRVVIGDQWLTDGLLAVRIGATFVRLLLPAGDVPLWPRLQQVAGWPVRPLFVRV